MHPLRAPQTVTKAKVLSLKLEDEQVVRPEGSLGALSTYLATLKDEDEVKIVSQVSSCPRLHRRRFHLAAAHIRHATAPSNP